MVDHNYNNLIKEPEEKSMLKNHFMQITVAEEDKDEVRRILEESRFYISEEISCPEGVKFTFYL